MTHLKIVGVMVTIVGLAACGQASPVPVPATARSASAKVLATPMAQNVAVQATTSDDGLEAKVAKIRAAEKKAASAQAKVRAKQAVPQASTSSGTKAAPKKNLTKKKTSTVASEDHAFLGDILDAGLRDRYEDADLINMGRGVCRGYADNGGTPAIYLALQVVGFSQSDAVSIMGAALNNYCPQYWTQATANTSTITTITNGTPSYTDPQFNIGDITVPAPYEVR